MTFDTANAYRRKSSLVPSESQRPRPRGSDKTQCVVHQFLDSQRRALDARNHDARAGGDEASNHDRGARSQDESAPQKNQAPASAVDRLTPQEHVLAERLVEPKGKCSILSRGMGNGHGNGHGSDASSDAGQTDEQHWASQITKKTSDMDLSVEKQEQALHSRLLTKKQLSEMAWGVRELSRRLGSIRLKFRVRNVFILTKIYDRDLVPKTRELVRWLLDKERDVRYVVYLEKDLKDNKQFDALGLIEEVRKDYVQSGEVEEERSKDISKRLRWWDEHMCRTRPQTFDFAITLGGDGTVLYASWLFQRIVPPVLSFALGSLGFLTKFDFKDYQNTLTGAFREGVTVSLRLRFEGTIMRSQRRKRKRTLNQNGGRADDDTTKEDEEVPVYERDLVEELIGEEREDEHTHKPDGTHEILNEIVVDRGPNPSKLCNLLIASTLFPVHAHNCPQQFPTARSSATMSTSPRSSPTASACRHRRARPPTISPRAARSATPRTP